MWCKIREDSVLGIALSATNARLEEQLSVVDDYFRLAPASSSGEKRAKSIEPLDDPTTCPLVADEVEELEHGSTTDMPLIEFVSVSSGAPVAVRAGLHFGEKSSSDGSGSTYSLGKANEKLVFLSETKKLIGSGAYSNVFQSRLYCDPLDMNGLFNDDNFSVPVAVKKMSWSALGAFPVIKMRMRMRLAHPNICFFFSGFLRTTGGSLPSDSRSDPFISASSSELATVELSAVIELSKFGSLAKYVAARKSSFSEAEVRSVALDTLRALEYLHFEVRAAHGDVKPLNILLFDKEEEDHPQFYGEIENFSVEHKKAAERKVSSFRMKIADFGTLTPIVPQDDVRTQLSREDGEYDPQGTFLYMSPEACLGCVGLPSIDVWALGIMLYQLATGTSPWSQTECSYPSIIGGNYRRKFEDRLSLLQDDHVSTGPLAEFGPFLDALEKDSASSELKDFVKSCLIENPLKRPTCRDLLSHPFMTKETS